MDARQQILSQATRLMAAHGFEGASLKQIADASGITKATLLYHFSSKDTLRQQVLDQLLAHWNEVLPSLLRASTLTGRERFDGLLTELIGFFLQDTDRARLVLREMLDRPEAMHTYLLERVRPWIEVIARAIRAGQRTGEVRPEVEPDAYILLIIHLVLSSLATLEGLRPLLGVDDFDAAKERTLHELQRLAKTSLFTDTPS